MYSAFLSIFIAGSGALLSFASGDALADGLELAAASALSFLSSSPRAR